MYDLCRWQSEIKIFVPTSPAMTRFLGRMDSTRSNSSRNADDYVQYQRFPPTLRLKSLVLGDSLPPQRADSPGNFYQTRFALEYMSYENRIIEDIDPSPFVDNEQSTLDTIYYARASGMLAPQFNSYDVIMTRYWGPGTKEPVIFSGFNIWNLTFGDCRGIVDGVLNGLWRLPLDLSRRSPPARMRPVLAPTRAWSPPAPAPAGRARSGTGAVAATGPPGR